MRGDLWRHLHGRVWHRVSRRIVVEEDQPGLSSSVHLTTAHFQIEPEDCLESGSLPRSSWIPVKFEL